MKQDNDEIGFKTEEVQRLLAAPSWSRGDITPRSQLSVSTVYELSATTPDTTSQIRRESSTSLNDGFPPPTPLIGPEVQKLFFDTSLDARCLMHERNSIWENRYLGKEHRRAGATFQGKVYNFLERPSGWKCFVYHFSVPMVVMVTTMLIGPAVVSL